MTALFWASCDDTSTSGSINEPEPQPVYGVICDTDPCMEIPESSGANDAQSSSSEAIASSSSEIAKPESSSSIKESSSSEVAQSSSSDIDESSSSFELPVPVYGVEPLNCYNDTAANDSGKVFDIIECIDGQKYLRFQSLYMDLPEKQAELPQGVHPQPPDPRDGIAVNCTREVDICIDGFTTDENGNQQPVGGCYPTIECPEKPQN